MLSSVPAYDTTTKSTMKPKWIKMSQDSIIEVLWEVLWGSSMGQVYKYFQPCFYG